MTQEKAVPVVELKAALGRFGHHPDPAIDFCVEVEEIQSIAHDRGIRFANPDAAALEGRIFRAMQFIVGGDEGAVNAKALLRQIEAQVQAVTALTRADEQQAATIALAKIAEQPLNDPPGDAMNRRDMILAARAAESPAMTGPTISDAELADRCERESRNIFPLHMRDGHSYHPTAFILDKAAAALRARAATGEAE